MNLKTTVILAVLVVAGGICYWLGPSAGVDLGLSPQPVDTTGAGTQAVIEKLSTHQLQRISLRHGEQTVNLQRSGTDWVLPGNWPTRKPEVAQLIELLTNLRSRFAPVPVGDNLAEYGLDKPAVTVTVQTDSGPYEVVFGEPPGDGQENRFSQPTYLRLGVGSGEQVEWKKEVLRLGPGLVAQLSRPADYYQQRRLFPAERITREGGLGDTPEKVERLTAKEVSAAEKKEDGTKFDLVRVGEGPTATWELRQPFRDHVDPDKLNTLLTALPDVWAEQFVTKAKDLTDYGLQEPEQTIQITPPTGGPRTLLVGKVSQTKIRTVTRPAPPQQQFAPPMPPMRDIVHEEYRYAKLADNDQVFEIKADKLKDIFVKPADLRDARLARFRTEDVNKVEIGSGITLVKKDGRWKLEKPIEADAESGKVTELLDKLAFLQARDKDVIEKPDLKEYGLDKPAATVTVTAEEEIKSGDDKTKVTRTYTYELGKEDKENKKLYVKLAGWDRVNAVENNLLPLAERPALAYRGRKVFDFATARLDKIDVQRGDEKFQLQQADGSWKLADPVRTDADAEKARKLADDLARFETSEYVSDSTKPEDLDKEYGLAKPALTATLTFTEKDKKPTTLQVGNKRPDKDEWFAKLADAPAVFVVNKEIHDALDRSSLAYRPQDLWKVSEGDIARLKIERQQEPAYTLAKGGEQWKISGPFDAPASSGPVDTMLTNLFAPRVERYEAHTAKDLAQYGLDKPYLRLTVEVAEKKPAEDEKKEPAKPKEYVLLIGKPAEEKDQARFAKLGSDEAVFVINPTVIGAVDQSPLELLDRKLLRLDTKLISQIKVEQGKDSLTLTKGEPAWTVEAGSVKFPPDSAALNTTLGHWANLQAVGFAAFGDKVDWAKYGLDKPAATVTVTVGPTKEGDKPAEHTLAIGTPVPDGAGDRYARLDNGPGAIILGAGAAVDFTLPYLAYVDRTLLKLDPAALTAIERQQQGNDLELVKKDDVWQIVKPAEQKADQQMLDALTGELARVRAVDVVAYPAKDVKEFGLDAPAAVISFKLGDMMKVLKIGKPAKGQFDERGRFVQVEGSEVVGILDAKLADRLLAGPVAFRDRNLARFADADRVVIERGTRKATFAKVAGTWKMTEPVAADAEQSDLEDFVNALARFRADELVADKPDPAKYGLDKPPVRYQFQLDGKDVLGLDVGALEKVNGKDGPRAYAKLAGNDLVFLLNPKQTKQALAEYRSRTLWTSLDSAQVDHIDYRYADHPFTLEKVGTSWQVVGRPEVKVQTEAVSDTLAALAALKAERTVADRDPDLKLYGLEPPRLTLEVRLPSGKRVLQIGIPEGESKRYYARVVDGSRSDVFVIGEADAARIVRDLKAFTQPEAKPAS